MSIYPQKAFSKKLDGHYFCRLKLTWVYVIIYLKWIGAIRIIPRRCIQMPSCRNKEKIIIVPGGNKSNCEPNCQKLIIVMPQITA